MTRPLNFTVVDILPALLSKAKTQTIRQVRKRNITSCIYGYIPSRKDFEKPATYKVGDEVKVYWNQRSKFKFFCDICGKGYNKKSWVDEEEIGRTNTCCGDQYFNKLLGEVEITDVFKIEMGKDEQGYYLKCPSGKILRENNLHDVIVLREYATSDGFKKIQWMFNTLDKMYNLASPKTFHVYRWKWL